MNIAIELAYEFVRQELWDEDDFKAFVLDFGLIFTGKKGYSKWDK
jgi:hypothetical protein